MPGPGRWTPAGTGDADLTLNGHEPGGLRSVLLTSGCGWHGYITNGEATDREPLPSASAGSAWSNR